MRIRQPLLVASLIIGGGLVTFAWLRDQDLGYSIVVEVGVAIGLAGVLAWFERKLVADAEIRTDKRVRQVERRLGQRIAELQGLDERIRDETGDDERAARAPLELLKSEVSQASVIAALKLARERRGLGTWTLVRLSTRLDGLHLFIDTRWIEHDDLLLGTVLDLSRLDISLSGGDIRGLEAVDDTKVEWNPNEDPNAFFAKLRAAGQRSGGFVEEEDCVPTAVIENLRRTAEVAVDARSGTPEKRLTGILRVLVNDRCAITSEGAEVLGQGTVLDAYEFTKPTSAHFGRDGRALPPPSRPPDLSDEEWDQLWAITAKVVSLQELLVERGEPSLFSRRS